MAERSDILVEPIPRITLRLREVAIALGVSERHARTMAEAGRLPAGVELGGVRVWPVLELREWMGQAARRARTSANPEGRR